MGGQTALNTAPDLEQQGVLAKFGVEMIGAKAPAIGMAEDRQLFREAMTRIGLATPKSVLAHSRAEALAALEHVGLPAIIRPSFTLGGTGGGVGYNREEFAEIVERGLDASPTHQVLIEESVLGWKEFEMEVVRDKADNCIIVCSIENVDPMGVHTGDSITVAPALTLTDKEYQIMRNAAIAVLREIGLESGLTGLDDLALDGLGQGDDKNVFRAALGQPTPDRILKVAQAMRLGVEHEQIHASCKIDPWFLERIQEIVDLEARVKAHGLPVAAEPLRQLKAAGFSDARLAKLAGLTEADLRQRRIALHVRPVFKRIDPCAAH